MLIRDRGQQGRIGRIVPRESIETQPFIYGPAFCIEIAMHETSRKANERQPILEVTREHPSIKSAINPSRIGIVSFLTRLTNQIIWIITILTLSIRKN